MNRREATPRDRAAKRKTKKPPAKAAGATAASKGSLIKPGAAKARTGADRKSKSASTSTAARKPAGRSRSGGARKSSKTSRTS